MLEPNVRTVFFEMLRPPEGYKLDEAIATTYTLDLITLLTAPLAFTTFEWADAEGKPTADPILLLEALRRNADRLTVFCQAGRAIAPAQQGILYSYLERMVVQVAAPLGGVFHPKLWLLRFSAEDLPSIMRLVVLSRNVTGDRCWDVALVLDGEIADRKRGFSAHAPLADFIQALPGLAVVPTDPAIVERVNRLAEDVRRADFKLPEGFDEYSFVPLGLKKTRGLPFPDKRKRMLVVSPFLTRGFLDNLTDGSTGHILVSRMEELAKLPQEVLAPFERVYVLADAAQNSDESTAQETADTTLTGLHAKLYLVDGGKGSTLYVGSANATSAAFGKNVELLVALTGKKSRVGIDTVLEPKEGETSLLHMLAPFVPPETPVVPDPIDEELEERLDTFRLRIATAGLRAVVSETEGQYSMLVMGAESASLPGGVSASLWPITVPEQANSRPLGSNDPLRFGPLPLAAVTAFFGVAAKATAQGKSLEVRFVLPLPLENAPSGRREAIMGALLDDPEKFLRFLQFLLGDLDDLGPVPGSDQKDGASFGHWGASTFVLFESLLRALKDDPQRLDYVASAVAELTAAENGHNRLPPGFLPIWESIWAARQEVTA
jgi:hypothetical protein